MDVGAAERACANELIAVVDVGNAHTLIAVSLAVAGDEARWCFPASRGTAGRTCWPETEDDVGRRAKFTEDEIRDGALETIAEGGPGGSDRGCDRDSGGGAGRLDLPPLRVARPTLARLWARSVERFQRGFLDALADDHDVDRAARTAALHGLDWARAVSARGRDCELMDRS